MVTPQSVFLEGKVVESLQSAAMAIALILPMEKYEKPFCAYDVRAIDI